MRSKQFLSIAAFFSAFILSAAFASLFISEERFSFRATSCFHTSKNTSISEAIYRDKSNMRRLERKLYHADIYTFPKLEDSGYQFYSNGVEEYVDSLENIDVSNLPSDFQTAWYAHTKAWRVYANHTHEYEDVSGLDSSETHNFYRLRRAYDAQITQTWEEVINVAKINGVNAD